MPVPVFWPNAGTVRKQARPFKKNILHHPFLDPKFSEDDAPLVPKELSIRGRKPVWELPRRPRQSKTELHIMLKLHEELDHVLDDFHAKIPLIDQALEEWAEINGASSSTTDNSDDTFYMAKMFGPSDEADIVYRTGSAEDNSKGKGSSIPHNVRRVDWLGLDGSYVHLDDGAPQAEPKTAILQSDAKSGDSGSEGERDSNTPPNLRISGWPADVSLLSTLHKSRPKFDAMGPFEKFWRNHGGPYGYQLTPEDNELTQRTKRYLTVPRQEWLGAMDIRH